MQKILMAGLFSLLSLSMSAQTQPLKFTSQNENWNQDSLGNHRVVVRVPKNADVAKCTIAWRRRDEMPQDKNILVVDAKTNKLIQNIKTENINREQGTIYFEPVSGAGLYYVYYMPYYLKGTYYPTTIYQKPNYTPDPAWLAKTVKNVEIATATEIQSVDAFNSFYPMEIIATSQETDNLIAKNKDKDYLVFPEDRMYPIKMTKDLPKRWIPDGVKTQFNGTADKGENYAYQLGIYPLKQEINDLQVVFSDLKAKNGAFISKDSMTCINTDGVNWVGVPEKFTVNIQKRTVQALWCTVNIADQTPKGIYTGKVTLQSKNAKPTTLQITIQVSDKIAKDHGVDQPWKQTRLTWLNSRLAEKNDVVKPYIPLVLNGNDITLLGRKLSIFKTGLPAQIQSYFSQTMTQIDTAAKNLFTEPVHFHFTKMDGKDIKLISEPIEYIEKSPGTISWRVQNKSSELDMDVTGSIEFDGFVNYEIKVIALQDLDLKNTTLHLPFVPAISKYIMGLGYEGQTKPDSVNWKWQVATRNQDGAWLGDVNAGLQYSLRDQHYVRPLNTNFYLQKPLLLPTSWGNDGKGGIHMFQKGAAYLVDNYTGERNLKKGDTLYYNFRLLITPFHTLDTRSHWENRYIHKYINTDSAKALGATVINIHQGTPINAYINYPFIQTKQMKAYIDSAHQDGLKVKIYNTVRELSNRAYELPALFSLGHEIYSKGKGGGYSWLNEHLDPDYIPAWFTPEVKDAAIVNSGMSRWHNYYVEGMNWLTKNIGIDGIYLDDVAFDRDIIKRVKRVITQNNHPGLIDLHSASQYDKADGYINSAMLYMELFPYLNRLWFGEKFDYEKSSKDYYLTEISGIPFGLMGEMLENDGNPWRGMLYGMTNRLKWSQTADPRPIWKVWDDFGIKDSKMIGYWVDNNPVKSNIKDIAVTLFTKPGKAMIAIASWAKNTENLTLQIDWKALGIDPAKVSITAPYIDKFQPEKHFELGQSIEVAPNKGWLIILEPK